MRTDKTRKMDRIEMTERTERTERLSVPSRLESMEKSDKTDKPHETDTAANNKSSLSMSELIYPKDFNLFDKRQMQFLLGKKLVQAVELESGEIMEEGEYITAEMLSRVRSRNTLMKLTAHIRKA